MNPGGGLWRVARGSILAVLCTLLAVLGHLGSGGHLPPLAGVAVTGGLLGVAFAVLADRHRGPSQLLGAAMSSQLLFHVVFAAQGHIDMAPSLRGLLLHAAGAVALAVFSSRSDGLLWSLVHLLRRVLAPSLRVVPAFATLPSLCPVGDLAPMSGGHIVSACPRRGPPVA